jgi:hypothetical protein
MSICARNHFEVSKRRNEEQKKELGIKVLRWQKGNKMGERRKSRSRNILKKEISFFIKGKVYAATGVRT